MKTHLITFYNSNFYEEERKITCNAVGHYFDYYKHYTFEDIDQKFIEDNKDIFSYSKGCGYFIWKPYVILNYITKYVDDGDLLVYMDTNQSFDDTIWNSIPKHLENNIIYVLRNIRPNEGICHPQTTWTKRDCFVLMGCDSEKYWNSYQVQANVIAVKKNKESLDFLNEWQNSCLDINVISDKPNICGLPNFPNFYEHRYDQSVLTNLITKYNIETLYALTDHPYSFNS